MGMDRHAVIQGHGYAKGFHDGLYLGEPDVLFITVPFIQCNLKDKQSRIQKYCYFTHHDNAYRLN